MSVDKLKRQNGSPEQWILFWAQPRINCDVYNMCGAFGLCDLHYLPFCTCVQGFAPASQSDWNNGDTSGGCIRQSHLECSTSSLNITFLATPVAYILPPNSKAVTNAEGIGQCEAVCLGECNCTVYAFSQICYVWYGDIIDVKVSTGHSNITTSVLYFRENASSLVSAGKHSQGTSEVQILIDVLCAMRLIFYGMHQHINYNIIIVCKY